jgi:hypothetical protein
MLNPVYSMCSIDDDICCIMFLSTQCLFSTKEVDSGSIGSSWFLKVHQIML